MLWHCFTYADDDDGLQTGPVLYMYVKHSVTTCWSNCNFNCYSSTFTILLHFIFAEFARLNDYEYILCMHVSYIHVTNIVKNDEFCTYIFIYIKKYRWKIHHFLQYCILWNMTFLLDCFRNALIALRLSSLGDIFTLRLLIVCRMYFFIQSAQITILFLAHKTLKE